MTINNELNMSTIHLPGVPDLDSDTSSSIFTATPRSLSNQPTQPISIPSGIETQHASLRRKKVDKADSNPAERSQSLQPDMMTQRPLSMVVPSQTDANMAMSPSIGSLSRGKLASDGDMEAYRSVIKMYYL